MHTFAPPVPPCRQGIGGIFPDNAMLMIVAALLVLLWGVGLLTAYSFGGYIHLLLLAAALLAIVQLLTAARRR